MLLTISTTHHPATDLGFLLHKHPNRVNEKALAFGRAVVLFPEANEDRCQAALLLQIDPIALVRGPSGRGQQDGGLLDQYVNDRPYTASSFMSVAIARLFGTAMAGRCEHRPGLADTAIPLVAEIVPLPCRAEPALLHRLFEPLGYTVEAEGGMLDVAFPAWGSSPFYRLTLRRTCRLAELLSHLYVLIPVLDDSKHYAVGSHEIEKLLSKGEGWLREHPERELITWRYLNRRPRLTRLALARLIADDDETDDVDRTQHRASEVEAQLERPIRLHELRLDTVVQELLHAGARRVLDLGCGEGRLLSRLLGHRDFEEIVGLDVSTRALEIAAKRLKLDELSPRQRSRIRLLHGALTYRDARVQGFDAAALVEVVEHLDPARLRALERVVFEHARPMTVIVTTPNFDYNAKFPNLPAGRFRHPDHRFEWTRAEFAEWAGGIAERQSYTVRFAAVGEVDPELGAPTQMGIFQRCA